MLKRALARCREARHMKLADWMENEIPEGFAVFSAVENDFA